MLDLGLKRNFDIEYWRNRSNGKRASNNQPPRMALPLNYQRLINEPARAKRLLKRNKMTGELAVKMEVHRITISRWRNGREPIPRVCRALRLSWLEGERQRIDAIGRERHISKK